MILGRALIGLGLAASIVLATVIAVSFFVRIDCNHRGIFSLRGGAITWWQGNGLRRVDGWYADRGWQAPILLPHSESTVLSDSRAFPLWIPLLIIAAPTALQILHAGRQRRGHCLRCGYDLRGLPAGVQCPECGANIQC